MNSLVQWGVILAVILIVIFFGSFFSLKVKKYLDDPEWNNIYVGIIFGVLVAWTISWYSHRDNIPYDWCFYLDETKSSYCVDLYDQATKKMQERSDYEEAQQGGIYPYGDARMQ